MTYGELLTLAKKIKAENPDFTVAQIDEIIPNFEFEKKDIRIEMIEIAVSEHGKSNVIIKEFINTTAGHLSRWNDVEFIDQHNPQVAIDAMTIHEGFDGDTSHPESWFATAEIDGVLCAVWGNGSMTAESTEIQYVAL
jgi:hypothetical protein